MRVLTPNPFDVVRFGLAVFALRPGPSRRPYVPLGTVHTMRGMDELRQSWRPGDNIGVSCRASRVVVFDLDRKDGPDGVAAMRRLLAELGVRWPDTLTVATPNNGLHLYLRAPHGWQFAPALRWHLAPGIDMRGPGQRVGGYVVGPGSVVHGRPYVIEHRAPIAAMPVPLAQACGTRLAA